MFASEFKHQINTLTSQTTKPEGEQGHCTMPYEHTWRTITNHRALPEPGPSHRWALTSRSCCRNSLPSTNGLKTQARRVPHSQLGVALNATLLGWTSLESSSGLFAQHSYCFCTSGSHTAPSTELSWGATQWTAVQGGFPGCKGKRGPHEGVVWPFCIKNNQAP